MNENTDRRPGISPVAGFLLQLAAGLVLTAVLLLVLELAAGLVVGAKQELDPTKDTVSRTTTFIDVNPTPMVRDPEVGWRNSPGSTKTQPINPQPFGRSDQWSVAINSDGFRGPERGPSATGGDVFRILCEGDSITFGFNVEFDASYPQQLLRLLAERYPGRHFDITNTGVPGWTWIQGLKFLQTRGMALEPDLIITGHGANDQFLGATMTDEERFRALGGPMNKILGGILNFGIETNIARAVRLLVPALEHAESRGCRAQKDFFGLCRRVSLAQISDAILLMSKLAAGAGADLLIANTDFVQTPSVIGARMAVEKGAIPFVDLVDAVYAERRKVEDELSSRLGLAPATRLGEPPTPISEDPHHWILRVLVREASALYRVEGRSFLGFEFDEPVYDDGTHGDEKAGDKVYTADIAIPPKTYEMQYKFRLGEQPEFLPLPPLPSTLGVRRLRTFENGIGPVHVFGQLTYMVEDSHPDREGHRIVARVIADKMEELPAFRAFVDKKR